MLIKSKSWSSQLRILSLSFTFFSFFSFFGYGILKFFSGESERGKYPILYSFTYLSLSCLISLRLDAPRPMTVDLLSPDLFCGYTYLLISVSYSCFTFGEAFSVQLDEKPDELSSLSRDSLLFSFFLRPRFVVSFSDLLYFI